MSKHHGLPGRLIVLEGPDGAGKSTQARRLFDRLALRLGMGDVLITREPWISYWGKLIRERAARGERVTPEQEMYTFISDRKEHLHRLVEPALLDGKTVVMDRYYLSSVVYQGGRGLGPEVVRRHNEGFAPRPDLTLLLCLQPEAAWARVTQRGGGRDAFHEQATVEAACRAYLDIECPSISRVMVDGMGEDEVTDELWRRVVERWPELGEAGGARPTTGLTEGEVAAQVDHSGRLHG
jgi:dTMP kinase